MASADERFARADRLLEQALDLPPGQRAGFVQQAVGDDVDLRELVLRLLADAETDDDRLAPGALLDTGLARAVLPEEEGLLRPGERVAQYRILRELGRGGMAVVYLAERADGQLDQQVALKLIKRGIDTDDVVRRFRQEGRIMALAQHPNIARVIDGGATDAGQPYFALEYVPGQPIDRYCDEQRRTIEERLDLFVEVARAVAYAHRNLVVHRDIKPSNILVTADGDVKLLDFGIAKILEGDPDDPERAALTRTGQMFVTPAYASPEQLAGKAVTTSSDVYQLGVLLYLLLTGHLPHRADGGIEELLRAVTTEPPPRPSALLAATGRRSAPLDREELEQIAAARGEAPERLGRRLRGDLDNIVLMALRREPERRYSGVPQLIDDIERFRAGRTVSARPDTFAYRLTKLVQRNRAAAALAAVLVVALVTFAGAMSVQARRLAAERDRANTEAEAARQVADLMIDIFEQSDPNQARGSEVTAREILERGSRVLHERLADQPLIHARLELAVGEIYENLGLWPQAAASFAEARGFYAQELGEEHVDTAYAARRLADIEMKLGHYERAEELLRGALDAQQAKLGSDAAETVRTRANLGNLHWAQGRYEEAEPLYDAVLAHWLREGGPDHAQTLSARYNLGLVYLQQARYDEADRELAECLEGRRRTLGADHPRTLLTLNALAYLRRLQGRLDEAEQLHEESLREHLRVLGPEHPDTLNAQSNLAAVLYEQGRIEESARIARDVLGIRRVVLGPENPDTIAGIHNLALTELELGHVDAAEQLARESLELARAALGEDHPQTAASLLVTGRAIAENGRPAEALALLEEAHAVQVRIYGAEHPDTLDVAVACAAAAAEAGQREGALRHLRAALSHGLDPERIRGAEEFEALAGDPELVALLDR
jgi:serine/threonine-protein kinase